LGAGLAEVCPDLTACRISYRSATSTLKNFGTWRDIDGRLVWGVNDFDEACVYPYTMDLVRLAASALLAARAEHLTMKPKMRPRPSTRATRT